MMADEGEISPLHEAAIQLHEMYLSLQVAGFSQHEAMELIARVMAGGMTSGGSDD